MAAAGWRRRRRFVVLRWASVAALIAGMVFVSTPVGLSSQQATPVMPTAPRPTDGFPPTDPDLKTIFAPQFGLGGILVLVLEYVRRLHNRQTEDLKAQIASGLEDRRVLQAALEKSAEVSATMRISMTGLSESLRGLQGSVERNTTATQDLAHKK